MKKNLLFSIAGLFFIAATFYSFTAQDDQQKTETSSTKIEWMTFEEAIQASQKEKKKIFIDMYTSWCGWCKVMDQKTFTNAEVIQHINENYYPVKFDAEQRQPITFKGKKYEFIDAGRRGIHQLAYELMNRNASYPSFVLLDENLTRIGWIKGYKAPKEFLGLLESTPQPPTPSPF